VFAHPEGITNEQPGLDGADAEVSASMQASWVAFATDGNPGENWEPYAESGSITRIDDPFELTQGDIGANCEEVSALTDTPPGA
jgi:carboxylesterase type B